MPRRSRRVPCGGRSNPNHQGNIFDHMFVAYEYRQRRARVSWASGRAGNCHSDNSDYLMGADGVAQDLG